MSETALSDAAAIRALLTEHLLGVFNERDGVKRRAVIAKLWEREGVFISPDGRFVGHGGIEEAANKVQATFPVFAFSVLAEADAHDGVGRLPWAFGPPEDPKRITGSDIIVVSAEGKIAALYAFNRFQDLADRV